MKLNTLFSYLNYVRRKDPIGGSISIPEFIILCEIVAFQFFRKITGLPTEYQKGSRDPIIGKGLNDISEEKLRPLKMLPVGLVLNTLPPISPGTISIDTYASYPTDYFRHGSCFYLYTSGSSARTIEIIFINDAKFSERRVTILDPPSLLDPVANLQDEYIRFNPSSLANFVIYLEYIRYPRSPIMGYVVDIDTGENIYVENGAYIQILTPGNAGDTITATSGVTTLGDYTTLSGDTADDVMKGLRDDININTLSHNVKAVYNGEKVVLVDSGTTSHVTLSTTPTGDVTLTKTNFSNWSVQFDWENDIEAMNEIAEMLLDRLGISNRDIPIVQWAEKEQAK